MNAIEPVMPIEVIPVGIFCMPGNDDWEIISTVVSPGVTEEQDTYAEWGENNY